MVSRDPSSSNIVLMLSSQKLKPNFMVVMWNKYYGNENPPKIQATDQPASSAPTSSNFVPPPELIAKPSKGVIHKFSYKTHSMAT